MFHKWEPKCYLHHFSIIADISTCKPKGKYSSLMLDVQLWKSYHHNHLNMMDDFSKIHTYLCQQPFHYVK